ncbi:T9SS type A sorting domain-containing protein [Hymenobacter chitinivorans]|uniref:Putative secreted protein (Por secretion system target) n=1 Tax=Hymenobacter chitinivorans DSM 11115 TaxID=1121954 RepID=A0A2M9BN71_9BACT|nr:T9SS type A sorting domain-containing protein [Hymenobacter chitinivorans]PJJ59394.1 putative secreted protein (Por secretion system target) [Hymenobacter chitinivorans DSM 11115]
MRALSSISTPAAHVLDSVASWWSHALILLGLLLMSRASRAQGPDADQLAFSESAGGAPTTLSAAFAYDGGSRCAGTVGQLVPAWANGAQAGTFSASPVGLSLNPTTGVVDLARSQAGAYTITNQLAAGGAAGVAASTFLVLHTLPSPVLTASGPTTFGAGGAVRLTASGGTEGATYQFFNNGQLIREATSNTYTATKSGSYTVLVINPGSCVAASAAVPVTVAPAKTAPELSIAPNPTPAHFTIFTGAAAPAARISVRNGRGEEVQTGLVPAGVPSYDVDLSSLAAGTYMLQVTTATGRVMRRVVRE